MNHLRKEYVCMLLLISVTQTNLGLKIKVIEHMMPCQLAVAVFRVFQRTRPNLVAASFS